MLSELRVSGNHFQKEELDANGRGHGYRKYYKSHAEQVMKPINVELTMGHDIGISASYYKPTEKEVLEDYQKAVNILTINGDNAVLQKQVEELKERNKDGEYIVKAKLQEKDVQLKTMQDQFAVLQSQVQHIISSIGNMEQSHKNTIAKKMYESGIYVAEEALENVR